MRRPIWWRRPVIVDAVILPPPQAEIERVQRWIGGRAKAHEADAAGVPFLFKQWGESRPYRSGDDPTRGQLWETGVEGDSLVSMIRVGKKVAGRELDGQHLGRVPSECRVSTTAGLLIIAGGCAFGAVVGALVEHRAVRRERKAAHRGN